MHSLAVSILLFFNFSCSLSLSEKNHSEVATDSLANNKIKASARRSIEHQDLCFEITLQMDNVDMKDVAPSNWTLALVDQNARYHLLNLTQRDPASAPERIGDQLINHFKVCSPQGKFENPQYLLLSPKSLPFPETEGMKFKWH